MVCCGFGFALPVPGGGTDVGTRWEGALEYGKAEGGFCMRSGTWLGLGKAGEEAHREIGRISRIL